MAWNYDREFHPDSSFVNWVGYDSANNVLTVDLARGGSYDYGGVPLSVYLMLQHEDRNPEGSVGEYFNSYITKTYVAPENTPQVTERE